MKSSERTHKRSVPRGHDDETQGRHTDTGLVLAPREPTPLPLYQQRKRFEWKTSRDASNDPQNSPAGPPHGLGGNSNGHGSSSRHSGGRRSIVPPASAGKSFLSSGQISKADQPPGDRVRHARRDTLCAGTNNLDRNRSKRTESISSTYSTEV